MDKQQLKRRRAAAKKAKIKRQKHLIIAVFSVFMLLVVSASCVAMKVIYDVGQTMDRVYEPVQRQNFRKNTSSEESISEGNAMIDYQSLVQAAEPISILLIGTDTGDFGRTETYGRSDVLIYCVLNPKTESLTLLSIPRDTYVRLPGYGSMDKINAAFAYGGPQLAIETVQSLLDLPVDAYAAVNFGGFKKVIDAIGGVTVQNAFTFSYGGYTFPEGTVTLDGSQALAFCRMRYNDPEGDFGRGRRQRNVIVAIAGKAQSLSGALNYQQILAAVGDNVQTDIDLNSALEMISQYSSCLNNVDNMDTLKGAGTKINGIYYYQLDEYNLEQIRGQLRTQLELDSGVGFGEE